MSKKKNHGRHPYQPPVNIAPKGTFQQVYSDLFPEDAKAVVDRMREFDTAWFAAHPTEKQFARKYIPGEAFPQHDPSVRYVVVFRQGNTRMRAFDASENRPIDMIWVDVPEEAGN